MFLNIEVTVGVEATQWHPFGPATTQGKSQQLSDEGTNGDTGLTQTEELVQATSDDGKNETDSPHAKSVHGERPVIDGLHNGTNFGEGGIVGIVGEDLFGIAVV